MIFTPFWNFSSSLAGLLSHARECIETITRHMIICIDRKKKRNCADRAVGFSVEGQLGKSILQVQILERPSIGEYWNISGVPVLPENVIFTSFRTCWCYSEAYNTGMQKWSSIGQYSCTSIWDLKYTFPQVLKWLYL